MDTRKASFKIIRFFTSRGIKFVGVAWNYDEAILISTRDRDSYTDARAELQKSADSLNVKLQWFDGEYVCENGLLVPYMDPNHRRRA